MLVRRLVRSRLVRTAAGLALVAGGVLVAVPAAGAPVTAAARAAADPAGTTLTPPPGASGGGEVGVRATIEDADAFCGSLSDIYDHKPSAYTVRAVNCRSSDVFVKGRYSNGSFGTCVLVPARHSRHLGGSLLRPMADSQVC